MKVAVYDSGVGGLSILQALIQSLPDLEYLFVSDNAAYPYGTKAEDEVLARANVVVTELIDRYSPDALVIACNTASTVCLPSLRSRFDIPIIGVVPAIKPAAQESSSKTIGLLATPATIKRAYTQGLIDEFAENCEVIRVGSSRLVDIAEMKLRGQDVSNDELELILAPFLSSDDLDTVVLACTHFPLLANEIAQLFIRKGKQVSLIDSGQAIARRLESVINDVPANSGDVSKTNNMAVFTAPVADEGLIKNLKSFKIDSIEWANI